MIDNSKMMIGEHFTYRGIEWICLDIIDGNYLAITAQVWQKLPFDVDCYNDWKESSLRKTLNKEFLSKLVKKHLVTQKTDLIADNGDKAYGTSEDYVTILSCDQYRKYHDIVTLFAEWMWTLTPCGTSHAVRNVGPDGYIYSNYAYNSFGVAPVVLFSAEHLKLSRQTRLVEIKKPKKET